VKKPKKHDHFGCLEPVAYGLRIFSSIFRAPCLGLTKKNLWMEHVAGCIFPHQNRSILWFSHIPSVIFTWMTFLQKDQAGTCWPHATPRLQNATGIPCSWWAAALLQVHKLWLPHSLTANYTCRQQWLLQWLWVCPKIWYSEILSVNHHFPPMTSSHLGFFQYIISIYTIFRHTQILVHIGSLR